MAQEMNESRKKFIDDMIQKNMIVDTEERINARVNALQKELREIADRAYQAAIGEKVGEYQEKANAEGLTPEELEAIKHEREEFEANPEAYGIVREKCPIKDETDQKRALEIVELLKDTKQLGKEEEVDFLEMIDGFGERNKPTEPHWMTGKQEAQ